MQLLVDSSIKGEHTNHITVFDLKMLRAKFKLTVIALVKGLKERVLIGILVNVCYQRFTNLHRSQSAQLGG